MQQVLAKCFQNDEAMLVALQHCLPNRATPTTVQIPAISPNATVIVPVGEVICPKCGFHNRPGAKFCKRDGQPLMQGVATAPPQVRAQAVRAPIQAKPVSRPQPIQARPARPSQARPIQPIQARPATNSASAQDPCAAAFRAGLQHLMNKNYVKAIEQFAQAQQQGGPSYDVLYNLGRAYRQYAQSVRDSDKKQFNEHMKRAADYFEDASHQKTD